MERKKETEKKDRKNTPPAGNTITAENGVEVYSDLIAYYADEYLDTLDDDGLKALKSIQGRVFSGMIAYIQEHTHIGTENIKDGKDLLAFWNAYRRLVFQYNQIPYVGEFCIMLDIHRDTFYRWLNGTFKRVTPDLIDTCKKIENECKQARLKGAAAGNVGMIFLCKAVDGLVETAPAPTYNPVQVRDNLEIASKMGLLLSDNSAPGKSEENG